MDVEHVRDMLAPTPPMGWNSYDSYGCAINEDQFRANVEALSETLLDAGYEYACIDAGWYHDAVEAHELGAEGLGKPHLDDYGRLIPSPLNFPSARDGSFKALADFVHEKGCKFGLHIMRGIPRTAVEDRKPVAGTQVLAGEVAADDDGRISRTLPAHACALYRIFSGGSRRRRTINGQGLAQR